MFPMVVENTKGPITQTECRLEVGEAGLERGGVGGGAGEGGTAYQQLP